LIHSKKIKKLSFNKRNFSLSAEVFIISDPERLGLNALEENIWFNIPKKQGENPTPARAGLKTK
jgi:hypothetical protein